MQNKDQWRLAAKSLAGEASGGEALQFQAMLDKDPALKEWYNMIARFWQQPALEDKDAAEQAFNKTWKKIEDS